MTPRKRRATQAPGPPIRPIGDRVLLRPVETTHPERLVQLTEEEPIVQGDVLAVGQGRCPDCAGPLLEAIAIGARVALRPTAVYQEVRVAGEVLWVVGVEDVVGEVLPLEEEPSHAPA